jgi:hypothetical protein
MVESKERLRKALEKRSDANEVKSNEAIEGIDRKHRHGTQTEHRSIDSRRSFKVMLQKRMDEQKQAKHDEQRTLHEQANDMEKRIQELQQRIDKGRKEASKGTKGSQFSVWESVGGNSTFMNVQGGGQRAKGKGDGKGAGRQLGKRGVHEAIHRLLATNLSK